jgi:hypothetical protein
MRLPQAGGRPVGHAHFWERATAAGFTRTQLLRRGAATVGSLAGLTLLAPGTARGQANSPKPIPGGLRLADLGLPVPPFPEVIHVLAPGVLTPANSDPITITDFNGHIGYAIIDGSGTGTNTITGETKRYSTNVDMRFMQGVYVGEDGRVRRGSFAFV